MARIARREEAASIFAAVCCLLFLALGLIVIRYPGIQNDEALFGAPLFLPRYWLFAISLGGHCVPMMLMSYLGTLKTLIYCLWFLVWPPSAVSIRLPALFAGAASVWLFFLFTRRTSGRTAASVATLLLATDVSFLLTSCFDWGPVALQHLLLISGVLLLLKFHEEGRTGALYMGAFLFGLGMWDKALFVWMLAGLVIAGVFICPREILRRLSIRRALLSLLCLTVGAGPLVAYNLKSHGQTGRANSSLSLGGIGQKVQELRSSLDNSVMLGIAAETAEQARAPQTALERFSTSVYRIAGDHRRNFNEYAFLLAVASLPLLWRTPARRPMLYSLVFMAVVWTQMAITVGAGGSVQHVILMWPFPLLLIAVAFTELSKRLGRFGRPILAIVVGKMAAQNVLVYNTCLERFIRNGADGFWSDAIYSLAGRLNEYQWTQIDVADWGIMNSVRLLDRGRLRLVDISFLLRQPKWGDEDRKTIMAAISNPDHIFINHVNGQEAFRGVGERLLKYTSDGGYERRVVETITDTNGRPVFELLRFTRLSDGRTSEHQLMPR